MFLSRKILVVLLTLTICICLAACGNQGIQQSDKGDSQPVTGATP